VAIILCRTQVKKFAKNFGLKVIGSLGVLLKAKDAKLIDKIAPLLDILKDSRIFIDDKTYQLVLKVAEEK